MAFTIFIYSSVEWKWVFEYLELDVLCLINAPYVCSIVCLLVGSFASNPVVMMVIFLHISIVRIDHDWSWRGGVK